jgi:hypothetical protein
LARLVIANSVGIKVGSRETRDIADIFAMTEKEFNERAYANPSSAPATTRRWRRRMCA